MSAFSEEQFAHLAKLCRIACTDKDKKRLSDNLSKILSYVDQLKELNTEGVPSTRTVIETAKSELRDDVVGKTLSREEFLSNAPSHIGGMIRVPPVIKFST